MKPSKLKPNLRPKLRIVFYENEQGEGNGEKVGKENGEGAQSYFYLEKTEATRMIAILKILPELKEWVSVSDVGEMIGSKTAATLITVLKMAGALRIDIQLPSGAKQVFAKRPVIALKKDPHYIGNISGKKMYLRSRVYIRGIFEK